VLARWFGRWFTRALTHRPDSRLDSRVSPESEQCAAKRGSCRLSARGRESDPLLGAVIDLAQVSRQWNAIVCLRPAVCATASAVCPLFVSLAADRDQGDQQRITWSPGIRLVLRIIRSRAGLGRAVAEISVAADPRTEPTARDPAAELVGTQTDSLGDR